MTTFFTSDTHFGDPRVLCIDRRPFPSIPAHDAALVERWNATVAPEDEVWHLGDFALGPSPARVVALLADLHGRKHGRLKPAPRQYDVGVDVWDCRPTTLAAILSTRRRPPVSRGLASRS